MSSQDKDFIGGRKCHQLLFGGQSVDLPFSTALPSTTPVNPYLGGNTQKNCQYTFWKPQFGNKYGPKGPPKPYMTQGDQGVAETPIEIITF